MKSITSSLVAVAALGITGQAYATVVDGISFDAGSIFKVASIYEHTVAAPGDVLSGYGEISQIDGSSAFCAGGLGSCELTFRFGGYTVNTITPTQVEFTGGWVDIYAHTAATGYVTGAAGDLNPYTSSGIAEDIAEATDGVLWLSLVGHTFFDVISGATSTLVGTGVNLGTGLDQGAGVGRLDVVGGSAAYYFDTDTISDLLGGFSDFQLGSSFGTVTPPPHGEIPLAGSADLQGYSIPEPASLALMGIGLVGFGVASRKRK